MTNPRSNMQKNKRSNINKIAFNRDTNISNIFDNENH